MNDDETAKKLQDLFFKQRKSLIAISALLLIFQYGEVSFEGLKLSGLEFKKISHSNLITFMWIAWAYFFIRYYQYFRDLPDKGIVKAFQKSRNYYLGQLAFRQYILHHGTINDGTPLRSKLEHYACQDVSTGWSVFLEVVFYDEGQESSRSVINTQEVNLTKRTALLCYVPAAFSFTLNTRYLSEYFLPFGIAVMPIINKFWPIIPQ